MLYWALGRALPPAALDYPVQAIVQEKAALRAQAAKLRDDLETCSIEMTNLDKEAKVRELQSGCCACATTVVTTTTISAQARDPHWNVESGERVLSNDCISCPHFPGEYQILENCVISAEPGWSGVLDMTFFQVEDGCDWLVVSERAVSSSAAH